MKSIQLSEDDYQLLEALVKSPVFNVLGKLIEADKQVSWGILKGEKDPIAVYRAQGRLTGLEVLTTLPALLVQRRNQQKVKKIDTKRKT